MKVKRLQIYFFRGIDDLTLEFNASEPTVLIGINGMGKSSILDCLAVLLSHLIEEIQNPTEAGRNFSQQDILNGLNDTDNEVTISLDDSRELTWSVVQIREGFEDFSHKQSNLAKLKEVSREINHQWKTDPKANIPLAVYYPVNRAVVDIPLEILKEHPFKQIDAYEQALTGVPISFRAFFQWFRVQEDVENELRLDKPNYRNRHLEAVRQAIYLLLPGFSNLRVRRFPQQMTVIKQGEALLINQLSDGEKCLLAMVGDLARRLAITNPSLSDPLQGSGVVLIDEIELHLHPKWQREIIPALTRTLDDWHDEDLLVSPLQPNCADFFIYTDDGQILATDALEKNAAATKTIKQLRLDIPKLKAMREEVIKSLLAGIDVFTLTEEEKQKLLQGFEQPDADGRYEEFCGAIAYILNQYFT